MPRNVAGVENRELAGPWAGFRFCRGALITPEGRALLPGELRWLSLTCTISREWQRMMDDEKAARRRPVNRSVIYMRDVLAGARDRLREA